METLQGKEKQSSFSRYCSFCQPAWISTAVTAAGANVINMQQSVVEGYFNLIMIIEISQATQSIEEMRESIASAVPNTQVHVMHENIFLSMHTI